MVETCVQTVIDLINAFVNTSLGQLVFGIMVFGTSVALFRYFESGAGGRDV
jgi:hypothetical protein